MQLACIRIQCSAVPQPRPSNASAMFADTPAFPFSTRDSVPRSHPKRAAVSVTFQPTSSMLSRISSPRCGGWNIERAAPPTASFMIILLPFHRNLPGRHPPPHRPRAAGSTTG